MIKSFQPLSIPEALNFLKKSETENPDLIGFANKFVEEERNSDEIREKINAMNLLKVKEEHIVKMIDLLPENSVDLNKIFSDVSLDENETKKLLDIIKQYK